MSTHQTVPDNKHFIIQISTYLARIYSTSIKKKTTTDIQQNINGLPDFITINSSCLKRNPKYYTLNMSSYTDQVERSDSWQKSLSVTELFRSAKQPLMCNLKLGSRERRKSFS